MKKIIHIITGLEQAGAETLLFRLIESSNDLNHIVISLTGKGYYGPKLTSMNVQVYVLNLNKINFFSGINKLYSLLKTTTDNEDVTVHCWMYHSNLIGGIIAKLAGIKNILWSIHHLDIGSLSISTRSIARLGGFISSLLPTKIIFVSDKALSNHVSVGYAEVNSQIIYNFVDTDKFLPSVIHRNNFRNKYCIDENAKVIGCVARWHPVKNHETLFKAFKALKTLNEKQDFTLVLVGPGLLSSNVSVVAQLTKYNIINDTILAGSIDNLEVVYPGFDLHVLPSLSEAFGLVTLEAMSCGVPVISSDVGLSRLIINSDDYIFFPEDYQALTNRLIKHFKLEEKKLLCINDNTKVKSIFSLENSLKNYRSIW